MPHSIAFLAIEWGSSECDLVKASVPHFNRRVPHSIAFLAIEWGLARPVNLPLNPECPLPRHIASRPRLLVARPLFLPQLLQ